MHRDYYERVRANIKAHPWKWIGSIVAAIGERLLEHRLLGFANDRIDQGATKLMPYIRDMLVASIAHPFWSLFVVLAGYSFVMIAIAHLSALRSPSESGARPHPASGPLSSTSPTHTIAPLPPSGETGLLNSLEIISDDGLGIHAWFSNQPLVAGLLISVINDRAEKLKSCKVRLARARSFDSKRKTFIDDLQAHVLLPPLGDIPHKQESRAEWLVRISHDKERLEIGRVDGQMSLRWPPREDIQNHHVWLLTVAVESETIALHEFYFRMEWLRPNTIKVRKP